MKNRAITTITAGLAIAAIAVAAGYDAVALKRVPKEGESHTFGMKIDIDFQGQAVTVTMDNIQKVTKVNADGTFVVSEETKNQVVMVGGQEVPNQGGDQTTTTTYGADGTITKVESASASGDELRLGNLNNTMWPKDKVDVGSKWEATLKGDKTKGTLDVSYSYEVLGREKLKNFDTFKIKTTAKESGDGAASAESTVWVDVATGLTVAGNGTMKGVPIMGTPMDATWKLELKS